MFHLLPIAAIVLYLAAAVSYTRIFRLRTESAGVRARQLLAAGFLFHALFVILVCLGVYRPETGGAPAAGDSLSFPVNLSVSSAVLVGLFLLLERPFRLAALGAFLAPVGLFLLVFAGVMFHLTRHSAGVLQTSPLLFGHIIVATIADVFFAFSFAVSIALIAQVTLLKRKRFTALQQFLPSLSTLDGMNARMIAAGVVSMACAAGAGMLFALAHEVSIFEFDPRIVWSFVVLLVYSSTLLLRMVWHVRGRRLAAISLVGFGVLVASFVAVNFSGSSFHVH